MQRRNLSLKVSRISLKINCKEQSPKRANYLRKNGSLFRGLSVYIIRYNMNYQETVEYLFTSTPVLKRLEPRHTNLGLIRCIKWMNTSDILITNINVSILQEPTEKVHHPIHLLQSCRARAIRSVCSHLHIL